MLNYSDAVISPCLSPSSFETDFRALDSSKDSLKLGESMVSGHDDSVAKGAVVGSLPNKKKTGRVPKKIHKAEREKLKRDHLNDLFLELGQALEPARQNNGKACILGDTARLLRDLIGHVDSLRKENAALLTESRYVTMEKNELKDENDVLEAEISRLRNGLHERVRSEPIWCNSTDSTPPTLQQPTITPLPMSQPSVRPLYVVPLHQDFQLCPEAGNAEAIAAPPKPPAHVRKPHARYPTPSDSWPLELLSRHPRTAQDVQHSSNSSSTSTGSEQGSDRT